jgi:hypothetical protein
VTATPTVSVEYLEAALLSALQEVSLNSAHSEVTLVLQWCHCVVTMVLSRCYRIVTVVFDWCFRRVTVSLPWCNTSVAMRIQVLYTRITTVSKQCYSVAVVLQCC